MAGKKKAAKSKVARLGRKGNRAMQSGLDGPAMAARQLLEDPCGARLVHPVYSGTGSGYLLRTRQRLPLTTNLDWLVEFTPSLAGYSFRFAGTTTPGAAYGNGNNIGPPSFLDIGVVKSYRCVAACLKVFYTGTELARQGEVALGLKSDYNINPSAPSTPAGLTYTQIATTSPKVVRLGESTMEVRWAPSLNDESFVEPASSLVDAAGNTIYIAGQNTPANSIIVELVAVWEWQPLAGGTTGSVVSSLEAPKSRNTLNHILSSLGDIVSWAVSPTGFSYISSAARTVNSVSRIGGAAMRAIAPAAVPLLLM